jgi:hypothetical protein
MKIPSSTIVLAAAFVLVGCAGTPPKEKPILQRGWIGGSYERAKTSTMADCFFRDDRTIYCFPRGLAGAQKAGILATSLGTNTPVYRAGLREGDLILQAGHQTVANLPDFWRIVTSTRPGDSLPVKVFRDGKMIDHTITAGREKYQEQGWLSVGLFYIEPLHPVPTANEPNFSLAAVGYAKNNEQWVEFASPEERYKQSCHPHQKQQGYDSDWKFWLAIVRAEKGKKILAQEPVAGQSGQ